MDFFNRKKTYLQKLDKSKKGEIDKKIISLIALINQKPEYFTTSSCSGRIVLWTGSGKKNETRWLKASHQPINKSFFEGLEKEKALVWLRLEPFILHVCCQDLVSAKRLLAQAKPFFKKSSLLSLSNKLIVEIKGSEFIELPLLLSRQFLVKEAYLPFLARLLNLKLAQNHQKISLFQKKIN